MITPLISSQSNFIKIEDIHTFIECELTEGIWGTRIRLTSNEVITVKETRDEVSRRYDNAILGK